MDGLLSWDTEVPCSIPAKLACVLSMRLSMKNTMIDPVMINILELSDPVMIKTLESLIM